MDCPPFLYQEPIIRESNDVKILLVGDGPSRIFRHLLVVLSLCLASTDSRKLREDDYIIGATNRQNGLFCC